jgi:hypothetical protein
MRKDKLLKNNICDSLYFREMVVKEIIDWIVVYRFQFDHSINYIEIIIVLLPLVYV